MERIFITGGAGFIGSHTVRECIRNGYVVTVYDRKQKNEAVALSEVMEDITYIEGDILDVQHLATSMEGHTHVLHLAALVSVALSIEDPHTAHEINVTGTLNVFEAARKERITRVVYASSAAVYGEQQKFPIEEGAPLYPQSPYGAHKAMADMYARLYNELFHQSVLGLRYFNVYGKGQDPHSPYSGVISIFVERIKQNLPITVYGDGSVTRDFISVSDIARANVAALRASLTGVCNIGSGTEKTISELIDTLEEVGGVSVIREHRPLRQGDILRSFASTKRAESLLGFTASDTLENGLRVLMK